MGPADVFLTLGTGRVPWPNDGGRVAKLKAEFKRNVMS